ncbi:hypothetical protein VNO80_14222 [Phaseolus coccineus]|uniref:Uncharacterized protein n=1 Tax=Phaseolus coccineus TaxID=3886 RepID=A0AAN9R0P8_PHACN
MHCTVSQTLQQEQFPEESNSLHEVMHPWGLSTLVRFGYENDLLNERKGLIAVNIVNRCNEVYMTLGNIEDQCNVPFFCGRAPEVVIHLLCSFILPP